jgi:hypothetical protein
VHDCSWLKPDEVQGDLSAKPFRCPSCDEEIEGGPYCRFCGSPVDLLSVEVIPEEPKHIASNINFDIPFSGDIDIATIVPLLSKVELSLIDTELAEIIEQTRATRQALKLENVDHGVLQTRAEDLRRKFESLKERKELLMEVSGTILMEDFIESISILDDKMERLEESSDTIEKEIYKEQKERLKKERKSLEKKIKSENKILQSWVKLFQKTKRNLQKALGQLDAKFKIGELSRSFYDVNQSRLERSISILDGALARIDEIQMEMKT